MAVQLLVEKTIMGNAKFRLWTKECPTPKFRQDAIIQSFFEVMEALLHADGMITDSATFRL